METSFESGFFVQNRHKLKQALGEGMQIVLSAHGLLQKSRDEAYPFRQESNFWYLTGVNEPDFVLVMDGDSEYLIAPQRSEYLNIFSGELNKEKLKETSGIQEVLEFNPGWRRLGNKVKQSKKLATLQPLPEYIQQLGIYTNPSARNLLNRLRTYNQNLKIADMRSHLSSLRAIKTDGEIRCIQKATDESVKLHQEIAGKLTEFKTEQELLSFIKKQAIDKGREPAYEPIAASGKNAAILHYEKGDDKFKSGEPVLVDAAFAFNRYCSDITRTYCLKPSERYRKIHDAVISVQKYAIELIKPGVLLEEYEKAVRQFMGEKLKELRLVKKPDEKSIAKYYPHSTSHFLGLDAHDPGDPDKPLEAGMVLTVEPGIYVSEELIGVRIEDTVLVTENGSRVLSAKLPKSLYSGSDVS